MHVVVDPMFGDLEMSLSRELSQYIVNVSEVKNSFYVVVGKPRGKILGCKKEKVFDLVENVSKNIYYNYCRDSTELGYIFSLILSLLGTMVIITSIY